MLFQPHLHKKGTDDPQILFITFWKMIKRSSTGIRSDHLDPCLDNVIAAFIFSPCDASLTSLFLQDSSPVLLENFPCLESFSCICNAPLTAFLFVHTGPVLFLLPTLLFFELFRVLLFFFAPENTYRILFFYNHVHVHGTSATTWSRRYSQGILNLGLIISGPPGMKQLDMIFPLHVLLSGRDPSLLQQHTLE